MQKAVDILGGDDMAGTPGVGPVSTTFDSSVCLVLILSSSLSIELSALVQDIVYFSINKKITDETFTVG